MSLWLWLVRALKMHGGLPKTALTEPDQQALAAGLENLGNTAKYDPLWSPCYCGC